MYEFHNIVGAAISAEFLASLTEEDAQVLIGMVQPQFLPYFDMFVEDEANPEELRVYVKNVAKRAKTLHEFYEMCKEGGKYAEYIDILNNASPSTINREMDTNTLQQLRDILQFILGDNGVVGWLHKTTSTDLTNFCKEIQQKYLRSGETEIPGAYTIVAKEKGMAAIAECTNTILKIPTARKFFVGQGKKGAVSGTPVKIILRDGNPAVLARAIDFVLSTQRNLEMNPKSWRHL